MKSGRQGGTRELRIIGGAHRGRRLRFPEGVEIRPTPDRVRETLFNWLQPVIHGARCLDLFAGSGALGLEALSRGAARVVFVDASRAAMAAIRATGEQFGVTGAEYVIDDALAFLKAPGGPYDVVFLDPPFDTGLLEAAMKRLAGAGCLATGAFCYVELPRTSPLPTLPPGWQLHRDGKAGEVGYHLLRFSPASPP
jgi:16S rRNA (guanine966-N2)-methyltransferase